MRDPARIPRILSLLGQVWEHVPDWRLGQLLANLHPGKKEVFFLEDDKTEEELQVMLVRLEAQAARDKPDEDQVLLGRHGPIYLSRNEDGGLGGVTVQLTGPLSAYEHLEKAAYRLVGKGLFEPGYVDGRPVVYFKFTKRGKIAHEALVEDLKQRTK